MNTNQLGSASELMVAAKLTELGYDIFFPLTGKTNVDLIASKGDRLLRISVKSTNTPRRNGTCYHINIGRTRHNTSEIKRFDFDKSSCDVLAIYIADLKAVCFMNPLTMSNTSSITIRKYERSRHAPVKNYTVSELSNIDW